MTIEKAIALIDDYKPNRYTDDDKIEWLSSLDGLVMRQIFETHYLNEEEEAREFTPYTSDTLKSTELLIPYPYDEECYLPWLEAKIDYTNGEYVKYNNSIMKFQDAYSDFRNDYTRHHMPKGNSIKYF